MNKRDFIKNLASVSAGVATLAALPACTANLNHLETSQTGSVVRRKGAFPNVPLVTHEGKAVRFYDDLVKNKTVMINFMYARCGDICPGMTANLKLVQKELGDRVGKDIFMYSISLSQNTIRHKY